MIDANCNKHATEGRTKKRHPISCSLFYVPYLFLSRFLKTVNKKSWTKNHSTSNSKPKMEQFVLEGPESCNLLPKQSFGLNLFYGLKKNLNKVAFIESPTGKETTYEEVFNKTCKIARALHHAGYKENDVMVLCGENVPKMYEVEIALLYLGIVAAPLYADYSKDELVKVMQLFETKIIFCLTSVVQKFIQIKDECPSVERIILLDSLEEGIGGVEFIEDFIQNNINGRNADFIPVTVNPEETLAAILLSSGTTCNPKSITVSHENINCYYDIIMHPDFELLDEDIFLSIGSLHSNLSFFNILISLIVGSTIVMMPKFTEENFLSVIQKYRIRKTRITPGIALRLIKNNLLQNYDLSSLEEFLCGSTCMKAETEKAVKDRFQLKFLRQTYGLTETCFTILAMPSGKQKPGSVGKIISGISVKIVDPTSGLNQPANSVGELYFKGNVITKGYYKNEEATNSSFKAGWFKSGDFGYYDEEGFFYIVDRISATYKYMDEIISPSELEGELIRHEKIKDAAVVGAPHDFYGNLTWAFIVPNTNANLTEEEVKRYIAGKFCEVKHLHGGVKFVDSIPRNSSGKIWRRVLKEKIQDLQ